MLRRMNPELGPLWVIRVENDQVRSSVYVCSAPKADLVLSFGAAAAICWAHNALR